MVIEKHGKRYAIKECNNYWSVSTESSFLSVEIKVDKTICKNEQELSTYILSNDDIF